MKDVRIAVVGEDRTRDDVVLTKTLKRALQIFEQQLPRLVSIEVPLVLVEDMLNRVLDGLADHDAVEDVASVFSLPLEGFLDKVDELIVSQRRPSNDRTRLVSDGDVGAWAAFFCNKAEWLS